MLPAEFGWSDLGSWSSLRILLSQDEAGNAKVGEDKTAELTANLPFGESFQG